MDLDIEIQDADEATEFFGEAVADIEKTRGGRVHKQYEYHVAVVVAHDYGEF